MENNPDGKGVTPLPVENLEQFAQLMRDWFEDKRAQVEYASNIPADVDVKATIDGVERTLTPQERQALIAGLQLTAAIFDKLPFSVVEDPNG